ncbi:MAG: phosphatidylcholine/phosphatidylserine synthase [Phycisphaerales bacterium]|nr:phosphatidylcholine/phosphatidylserine synthase [Phycisphaerales bacterium]
MSTPTTNLEAKMTEPKGGDSNPFNDPLGRSRREVELRKLIPNMMTGGAFCCGLASIYFALKYNPNAPAGLPFSPIPGWSPEKHLATAIALIGMSFLLDGFDGRMARMLKVTSRFGEKFDSIADFVSFGVAPAFILFKWRLFEAEEFGYGVSVIYSMCAAIRLARFTVQAKKKNAAAPVSRFFSGLPAPAAAFVVLIPVMLSLSQIVGLRFGVDWTHPWLLWSVVAYTLLVAGLMVSTIPMASVKHVKISRRLLPVLMVGVGLIAACMIKDTWLTLSVLAAIYVLSLPLSMYRAKQLSAA